MSKYKSHALMSACPRCESTFLRHVHCATVSCAYRLTVCEECDRAQVVERVMDDHMKDCASTQPACRVAA